MKRGREVRVYVARKLRIFRQKIAPLIKPVIIAICAWFLLDTDPLGIEEATAQRSERAAMRISSALYEHSGLVTVVLIDQHYLDANKLTWPLSYGQQGVLLRAVSSFKPAGIFVDLLYKNPHGGPMEQSSAGSDDPTNLLRTIRISDDAAPIYLAGLPLDLPGDDCTGHVVPKEARLSVFDRSSVLPAILEDPRIGTEHIAMVAWSGCGNRYPLFVAGTPDAPTPAYALYRESCRRPDGNATDKCNDLEEGTHYSKPMTLRWGAFPPVAQQTYYSAGVCQELAHGGTPTPLDRAFVVLWQFLLAAVGGIDTVEHPNAALPCPAINVVPPSVALNKDPSAEALFKDKFVFIGASIPGIPDWSLSPVHGQIPSVQVHAMALDNLLSPHKRYVRDISPGWMKFWSALLLVVAAIVTHVLHKWLTASTGKCLLCLIVGQIFWVAVAVVAWLHDDYQKAVFALAGGVFVTYLSPVETLRALLVFLSVCVLAVLAIECGYAPDSWIALAVAMYLVSFAVKIEQNTVKASKQEGKS